MLATRQEVPHSVNVIVDKWEETPRITRIYATIRVERDGQKVVVPMRYQCRLPGMPPSADAEYAGPYNARRDLLATLAVLVAACALGWVVAVVW